MLLFLRPMSTKLIDGNKELNLICVCAHMHENYKLTRTWFESKFVDAPEINHFRIVSVSYFSCKMEMTVSEYI